MFLKHFKNGNMQWLGQVRRNIALKHRECKNQSFMDFIQKNANAEKWYEEEKNAYRMMSPKLDNGMKSLAKYDNNDLDFDLPAMELAGEWEMRHFYPYMSGSHQSSEEECIQESDKTTSVGTPWNLGGWKNKGEFYESGPVLMLSDFWEQLKKKEPDVLGLWTCSEKREMRIFEKWEQGKVRTFTASPIELTIALNRLCLDMNNRFYACHGKTWSFVGTSKFFRNWHALATRLLRWKNTFELDVSSYDSTILAYLLKGQRNLRFKMLAREEQTEENWRILVNLYDSIIYSQIVAENGDTVRKFKGNPSGSANTIVDNTMILFRLLAYAWIMACRKNNRLDLCEYTAFLHHVEAALNGDDNTFSVSDEVVSWFNTRSICDEWSKLGIVAKAPTHEPQPLEKVSFLSQNFEKRDGVWVPVPERSRVLCSLLWGADKDDVKLQYVRACGLRIDSYMNIDCRNIIADYIIHLEHYYKDDLDGSLEEIRATRGAWKTDNWIEALYTGVEASEVASGNLEGLIKSYVNHDDRCSINLNSFCQANSATPVS